MYIRIRSRSSLRRVGGSLRGCNLDEKTWLDESHALAESVAYDPEVLGHLRGYAAETEAPPITLTERYLKQGGAWRKRGWCKPAIDLGLC